jgi:hypothetical protein
MGKYEARHVIFEAMTCIEFCIHKSKFLILLTQTITNTNTEVWIEKHKREDAI